MATKVYLCWSGDLSKKLAEAIRGWLPGVLQFVKPYFTPSDIEKGAQWSSEVIGELNTSDVGIICLTKDNLNRPWILFESGALSKNFDKQHVCTVLFNVETSDLTGPLTLFQNTRFEQTDFKKLVRTVNATGGDAKLDDAVLDNVFSMWWPKLEIEIGEILKHHEKVEEGDHRSERDILEEILELARLNARSGQRKPIFPKAVVMDLITLSNRLMQSIGDGNLEIAREYCSRLETVIGYMCRHSESPDLIEYYKESRLVRGIKAFGADEKDETSP